MKDEFESILEDEEERQNFEDDTDVLPPPNVFTYSETRSCYDIARMINEGDLKKDPFYQREDIWKNPEKTRFIDSLLKRLPIPSMCFSVDQQENYEVIDGRQRVNTIIEFFKLPEECKESEKPFKFSELKDIDKRISGKTLEEVKINFPEVITIIKNCTIPINMLKCDYNRRDNLEYIFKIFHRLNSGGMKLNNQEIRNCIYSGDFNELIKSLDKNTTWKKWVPSLAKDLRLRGQERILAFFAFYYSFDVYEGNLTAFLNDFMEIQKKSNQSLIDEQESLFTETINLASAIKLKYQKNVYIDSVLYGIAKNINHCKNKSQQILNDYYNKMLMQPFFSKENIQEGTAAKDSLKGRLTSAQAAFGGKL